MKPLFLYISTKKRENKGLEQKNKRKIDKIKVLSQIKVKGGR